jgi:hypothetical protein
MERRSVFESLASRLSTRERQEMLERMSDMLEAAGDEPLSSDLDSDQVDLDAHYQSLNIWQKFLIFLQALFSGQDRIIILEQHALIGVARTVNNANPDMVDVHNGILGGPLFDQLQRLREASESIAPVLRACSGADKPEFLVFLTGMEMGDFQELVESRTDPYRVAEAHSDLTDIEIRRRLEHDLDDLLSTLPAEGRQRMYQDAQLVYMLQQLVGFRFSELLGSFVLQPATRATGALFVNARENLSRLSSILLSMTEPPNPGLVKAMVLFATRDGMTGENQTREDGSPERAAAFERMVESRVEQALKAFQSIRSFGRSVPIRSLMRCVTGNLSYRPELMRGGEDWFAVLRRYWRDHMEERFRQFVFLRKRDDLLRDAGILLDGAAAMPLRGYPPEGTPGEGVRFGTSLAVSKGFFSTVYAVRVIRPLKTVLIDGEFYKEMNRNEFVESYNVLDQMASRIRKLEEKLRPDGDYGAVLYREERGVVHSSSIVDQILRALDEEVSSMLDGAIGALRGITEVVNGILYGEVGGRYDTLSNLGYVGGRNNKEYLQNLDAALRKCKEAARVLGALYDLESLRR